MMQDVTFHVSRFKRVATRHAFYVRHDVRRDVHGVQRRDVPCEPEYIGGGFLGLVPATTVRDAAARSAGADGAASRGAVWKRFRWLPRSVARAASITKCRFQGSRVGHQG